MRERVVQLRVLQTPRVVCRGQRENAASPPANSNSIEGAQLSHTEASPRCAGVRRPPGQQNAGELLEHVSTANTARDLELLRRAVGDEKLTYHGISYSTYLGAIYANLFPGRVRPWPSTAQSRLHRQRHRPSEGTTQPLDTRQDVPVGSPRRSTPSSASAAQPVRAAPSPPVTLAQHHLKIIAIVYPSRRTGSSPQRRILAGSLDAGQSKDQLRSAPAGTGV